MSLAKSVEPANSPVDKVRGKAEKFAEHYNQAQLFFDSQTPQEQAHIIAGFRFELSKVTVPAIRTRMVSSLRNVSEALAKAVAQGLGMDLPQAMPRAIKVVPPPEIKLSRALSLTALPGNGGVATRKIAMLVAPGMHGASLSALIQALSSAGAVPVLLSTRLGTVTSAEGKTLSVDATLENSPAVLFDAVVLPDGGKAIEQLSKDGHTLEFLKDQYRHGKTILALGASSTLLTKAGISTTLPSGNKDPGILLAATQDGRPKAKAFMAAVAQHRHAARDMDPPLI